MVRHLKYVLIITLLLASSCGKNSKNVDLSSIELNVEIHRFELDLFNVRIDHLEEDLPALRQKYPVFYPIYIEEIMNFGAANDSTRRYYDWLIKFFSNPYIQELNQTVQTKYGDIDELEIELERAFKHFSYYFPNRKLPKVCSFISEFGYGCITVDTTILGLGLDMFLGADYKYYPSFDFPQYMINRFTSAHIVPNAMKVMYNEYFIQEDDYIDEELVHQMIERGKRIYFLEHMMPQTPINLFFGYSSSQFDWCQLHETNIWEFLIEKELLFEGDQMDVRRLLNEGPSTSGMPEESPGNVGSFIGWKIVRQFAKRSEYSLPQLMNTTPEMIYNGSRYKPGKMF